MANVSRVGGKKAAKKAKKAAKRKSRARVAQGKKLARNNKRYHALLREGYSKAEAKAEAFGHRTGGKRAKAKAKKAGGKKGKRKGTHRSGSYTSVYKDALDEVQARNGTLGLPPTEDERYAASLYADLEFKSGRATGVSSEERIARQTAERLKQTATNAAKEMAKLAEAERKRQERKREAEREEARIRDLAEDLLKSAK